MPESDTPRAAHDPVLVRRLEGVEQENGRLRRLSMFTMVGMALLLGLAAAAAWMASRGRMPGLVPDVVEGRQFVLRGEDGKVRGAWGFGEDGALRLVMQQGADSRSVKLQLLPDGSAGLTFSDSTGNPRMVLGFLPDATGSLVFADADGRTRSAYGINPNGSVTLVFADRGGRTRTGLGVDQRDGSMLILDGAAAATTESPGDTAAEDTSR